MSAIQSYVSVVILFIINLLNYMDRLTIAGVLNQIESYYGLNHSQSGLLQTAFIFSYMIFAPIFGYLGDRYSRKWIMIFGIILWSLATFLGSFVPSSSPGLFFILRALVGIGEASYSTIAPTIIADLFAPEVWSKMLGFFYFAIPVGSGFGYIVGSAVAEKTGNWKDALRVTPPLGIVCAFMIYFLVREPQRGESEGIKETQINTSIKKDLKYLITVRSYIWGTIGFTCVCFAVGALSWWAPTYMKYAYDVTKNPKSDDWIGLIFGVIACIGGILGVIIGVGFSQYFKQFNNFGDPIICGVGVLAAVPIIVLSLALAHKSSVVFWLLIFIGITLLSTNWSIVADMLLYVITPTRRSFAQSLQILTSHLFGDASSPFIIGLIADSVKSNNWEDSNFWSLQYSLYLTPGILIFGGLAFLYTAMFIVSDKENCKIQTQEMARKQVLDDNQLAIPLENCDNTNGI
ncbi:protein spinster homolog 1-like [Oppia nitens]|uniref:protein spinster homolog 1-like n=1 Tax=Oppia nitens TaxID=1686743 RepID=UPI0023D9D301|nr:protein spinster homolog 1-like [Oppia nitens]XP_054167226.1 protein spinster homolog 1-like [Oppia nitens]